MPGNWEREARRGFPGRRSSEALDVLVQTFPPDLPGTFWVHIINHSKHFQMHHEMYMIAAMHRGGGRWICDGRDGGMGTEDTAVFEPGQFHRVYSLDAPPGRTARTTQDVVAIEAGTVQQALDERGVSMTRRHLRRNTFGDPRFRRAALALFARLEPGHDRLDRETALAELINVMADVALEGEAPPTGIARGAVRRAKEILRFGFRKNLSLEQIAREVGLSKYHLIRAFDREVGTTPHRFLTEVRITHARRLMMRGLPTAQVALESGFCDQSHLNRCYRKTFGVPPVRGRSDSR
jgi:AraC-like DNA-binding protein